jgi:hypothetical protein
VDRATARSGGERIRQRPDQATGGSAVAAEAARRRHGSGVGAVGRCKRRFLEQRNDDGGIGDGGSGAVWEASASGDQTESSDLLMA